MSDNLLKNACQSGAFSLFMEMAHIVLKEYDEVKFNRDPYVLSYAHGCKDGAKQFLNDLENRIVSEAKK